MPLLPKCTLKQAGHKKPASVLQKPAVVAEINDLAKDWKTRLGAWPSKKQSETITLASDCSGYGSELLALRLLGLQARVKPVMISEKSESKLALHKKMTELCGFDDSHCKVYSDIFKRNSREAPRADLYVAGFPCPSFSRLGKRRGTKDPRGMATLYGLLYLATKRPRVALLEQVAAMLDRTHTQVWSFILKILKLLEYEIVFEIVNTRSFGIPQSRPRLYVLCIAKECLASPLAMPAGRTQEADLHTFLQKDLRGTEKLDLPTYEAKLGRSMWMYGFVLDVQASPRFQHSLKNCAPCLTRTRCKQAGYYIPKLLRRLSPMEMAKLQGLPLAVATPLLATANDVATGSFQEALGDAMSINVLQTLLGRVCTSAGLAHVPAQKEYWLQCPASKLHELSDRLWAKYQ
eukprot:s386_g52.t1